MPWEVFGIGIPVLAAGIFFFLWRIWCGKLKNKTTECDLAKARNLVLEDLLEMKEREPEIVGEELKGFHERMKRLRRKLGLINPGEEGPDLFKTSDDGGGDAG